MNELFAVACEILDEEVPTLDFPPMTVEDAIEEARTILNVKVSEVV